LDLLKKHRVCIVAGPPGIGKTTLAQMLMLQLSADGFVPVLISEDVSEGFTVWKPEEKQFFYYGRLPRADGFTREAWQE